MNVPALLLRCLLALALVAGGVPTYGMARDIPPQHAAPTMVSCHDVDAPAQATSNHDAAVDADCCDSADCLCDCLQHLPAATLARLALAALIFPAEAPASRSLPLSSPAASTSLRPPIG